MSAGFVERFLRNEDATSLLGEDLAAILKGGDMVTLSGALGSGKTSLARAIIRALANDPALEVSSPTYVLSQQYQARLPVQHFDLYRITSADELEELGLDEALTEGIALIEWPDRAGLQWDEALHVELSDLDHGRRAVLTGPTAMMDRLFRSLAIRDFLDRSGAAGAHRAFLLGDASLRAFETVTKPGGETLILMNAPRRRGEPLLPDGTVYSRTARLAQSVTASVAVAELLRSRGFCAPDVHASDLEAGFVLMEHLGDGAFLAKDGTPQEERYLAAAELLAALHAETWPRDLPAGETARHTLPDYDRDALEIESRLMMDWYWPSITGRAAGEADLAAYRACWKPLFARLADAEQSLVLRDFHSPNIIWRGARKGFDRLGLIDVQDALIGPAAYDVASLALDARVDIPEELERKVKDAYCAARARQNPFDRPRFEEAYAICAAQRNSKLLGIFVRLEKRDGKPAYRSHLPRIRDYLRRVLHHPTLRELNRFYDSNGLLGEDGP